VLQHGITNLLIGVELHLGIDGQAHGFTIHRGHHVAHRLDHPTQPVLDHTAHAIAPRQLVVLGQLDAFLPLVFDVGEANHVRRRLTLGVVTLGLAQLMHAFDLQRSHGLRHVVIDLAAQPDKIGAARQALVQLGHTHVQQLGQFALLGRGGVQIFGDGPQRGRRHAGGQQLTIAIQDAATIGLQSQAALVATGPLLEVEIVLDDLDPGGAADEHGKAQTDRTDHEFDTPRRRARGQQRAAGITHGGHGRQLALTRLTTQAAPQGADHVHRAPF